MITSSENERLKLVRKLRDRKWREREGLFATEGEDLLALGREQAFTLAPLAVAQLPDQLQSLVVAARDHCCLLSAPS